MSDVVQNRANSTPASKGAAQGKGHGKVWDPYETVFGMTGKGQGKAGGLANEATEKDDLRSQDSCENPANKPVADALNLAGLLEVLDGVVDSPGRIVIMTTNHPENLDPALIRPGRVNFSLELGHMKYEAMVSLIQHIMLEELTPAQ